MSVCNTSTAIFFCCKNIQLKNCDNFQILDLGSIEELIVLSIVYVPITINCVDQPFGYRTTDLGLHFWHMQKPVFS